MKYKGYEVKLDLNYAYNTIVFTIPEIDDKQKTYSGHNIGDFIQHIKDTVDLHIGRSAERETCEKRIDPEEVAIEIYKSNWINLSPGPFNGLSPDSQENYKRCALAAISCIKKIDPSIISDDINHGVKHKFDRETVARLCWEDGDDGYRDKHNIQWGSYTSKETWLLRADRIISYIEEKIYG